MENIQNEQKIVNKQRDILKHKRKQENGKKHIKQKGQTIQINEKHLKQMENHTNKRKE